MKDLVGDLRIPAGFFMRAGTRSRPERTAASRILCCGGPLMPPWMEILINVIGYAGFIGIAKYHKPSGETEADHQAGGGR